MQERGLPTLTSGNGVARLTKWRTGTSRSPRLMLGSFTTTAKGLTWLNLCKLRLGMMQWAAQSAKIRARSTVAVLGDHGRVAVPTVWVGIRVVGMMTAPIMECATTAEVDKVAYCSPRLMLGFFTTTTKGLNWLNLSKLRLVG